MQVTFWAHFKSGRRKFRIGPFPSREEAVSAALQLKPKHKTLMTGYGSDGGWFDMRWHDKETRPY